MRRLGRDRWWLVVPAVVAGAVALYLVGCGDKIAIPEPVGLFGVNTYYLDAEIVDPETRQLLSVQGNIFSLSGTALTKRNRVYEEITRVEGFADARALCADDDGSLVFVWDQGLRRVTWYSSQDLAPLAHTDLPDIQSVVAMTASRQGIEQMPGSATFVYLADPDSAVVHRYAFDPAGGLIAYGILCHGVGQGARSVHQPGALARDSQDSLLVCDRDPARNWVIRFLPIPDLADTSTNPDLDDPLRGQAALFHAPTCNPPAAADYVLGDAPGCDPLGWAPGPRDALGAFDDPRGVAVDGLGRIFVSDFGNDRLQRFDAHGTFELAFGSPEKSPSPTSVAVLDVYLGDSMKYGAFVYVITENEVRRFISGEAYDALYDEPPPPPK
jgi:hypothetical protein